jgi:hypothetical protein
MLSVWSRDGGAEVINFALVCVCVCVCVCVRERESEREKICIYVCVYKIAPNYLIIEKRNGVTFQKRYIG